MTLHGKGMFIWKIRRCEGGDPEAIARVAAEAGLTHVVVKVADGIYKYNVLRGRDLVPPLITAMKRRGIQVWGWHYVYGNDPVGEANRALQRARELDLEGYILDAEDHYKGKFRQARVFMRRIQGNMPIPLGLSSYRFPEYHPDFPWQEFMPPMDYVMPQVYWLLAHNPGDQLRRSLRQLRRYNSRAIYVPTGSMYRITNWRPSASEIREFMQTAIDEGLPAVNFWEWYWARTQLPDLWQVMAEFPWPPPDTVTPPPGMDPVDRLVWYWNRHDAAQVAEQYHPGAVLVTASQVYVGRDNIQNRYAAWFQNETKDASFSVISKSGHDGRYRFRWIARLPNGRLMRGEDTLNMRGSLIGYHYTYSAPV